MTERPQRTEREITSENLPEIRLDVASLREQKGKEDETLEVIRWAREGAKKIEAHEDVVDLYWEEYLVGKHMAMEARDKEGLWKLPLKIKGLANGYILMRTSAKEAGKYIEEYDVEAKRPRSGRFLGEVAMFERRYGKAIEHFKNSVELFEEMENWQERVNALELKGFLAEATILSGDAEKGVAISRHTFLEYDSDEGIKLKENDYYTWAVWKSGCAIKAWHALLARNLPINDELVEDMIDMLVDVSDILVIPEDEDTWGDKNFEIRKQEITSIKRVIKEHGHKVK